MAPLRDYEDFLQTRGPIYAADRGGEYLWEMGLLPDFLVGDFDSLPAKTKNSLEKAGVPIKVYPEAKDETDLEIAANLVLDKGFRKIIILGAWGGRPDQSLAGISVLHKIKRNKGHGLILNPRNSLELISQKASLEKEKGKAFSLVPWGGDAGGLTIEGCRFNTREVSLKPWQTLGISNEVKEKVGTISLKKGLLLLIRELTYPFALDENSY